MPDHMGQGEGVRDDSQVSGFKEEKNTGNIGKEYWEEEGHIEPRCLLDIQVETRMHNYM